MATPNGFDAKGEIEWLKEELRTVDARSSRTSNDARDARLKAEDAERMTMRVAGDVAETKNRVKRIEMLLDGLCAHFKILAAP